MSDQEPVLRLRKIVPDDAKLLFRWVNSPDCLQQKQKTGKPIPWEVHKSWMDRRMADPVSAIWIAELDKTPVGQVRVQKGEYGCEVDIYVAPDFRRRGFALQILNRARVLWCRCWPDTTLIAHIKATNKASCRLFEKAGYEFVCEYEGILRYQMECRCIQKGAYDR